MNKKNDSWLKRRHSVVRNILYAVIYPYSRLVYGITIKKFKEQEKRPYLILYNHQTAFDQFFVGMSFSGPLYYVASEDIFSKGWISSVIRFLVAPIPIKKQTTDVRAVMNCIRVAKEGGSIAIAPEGNRTYSGKTEYMNGAIASLAKKLKLPIAIYKIEGGYGVHPRWSDKVRRGKMRSGVSRVIMPEEYADMSQDTLLALIQKEMLVDEGNAEKKFLSAHRAEYLERAMYVCPFCKLSEFESNKSIIKCKKCGREIEYGEDTRLTGIGFDFPFKHVTEWYDYQKTHINSLDMTALTDAPVYTDRASLSEVIVYKEKILISKMSEIQLFGDRIVIDGERVFPFAEVTAMSVLGKNKLNIYHGGKVYQLKSDKRFNALKYVNFYFRYRNIIGGNSDVEFLGL